MSLVFPRYQDSSVWKSTDDWVFFCVLNRRRAPRCRMSGTKRGGQSALRFQPFLVFDYCESQLWFVPTRRKVRRSFWLGTFVQPFIHTSAKEKPTVVTHSSMRLPPSYVFVTLEQRTTKSFSNSRSIAAAFVATPLLLVSSYSNNWTRITILFLSTLTVIFMTLEQRTIIFFWILIPSKRRS